MIESNNQFKKKINNIFVNNLHKLRERKKRKENVEIEELEVQKVSIESKVEANEHLGKNENFLDK